MVNSREPKAGTARRTGLCLAAVVSVLSSACSGPEDQAPGDQATAAPERLQAEIVAVYPFDETSFTQGLEVKEDGTLLVGTGLNGRSRIYTSSIDGQEQTSVKLAPEFFGEGITQAGDRIWQLTWRSGEVFERDAETLEVIGRAQIDEEGWGLCALDEDTLVRSDGSDTLRFNDAETFAPADRAPVPVTDGDTPINDLNELECVDGQVFANIFAPGDEQRSRQIARIDPVSGQVTAWIDASSLPDHSGPDPDNVLNGIAHLPGTDRFLLAGKRWPDLYEVRFVPA